MPLLIFTYSLMGLLICKYEPFRQEISVYVECDTQVTVESCEPLVIINIITTIIN